MLNTKLFSVGDVVAVALSGGKDSMCLLDVLINASASLGITVKAINVDHGIRGEQSKSDSLFVRNYCEQRGVPLKQIQFDCIGFSREKGMSVEEGARKLRYDYFHSLIEEGFCNKIATAHHRSDSVETVLFNLFRGVSPSGLKGIPEKSEDGKIIRPLINAKRQEIDGYAEKHNLPFVVDESNLSDGYSRNFLRLNVIPTVKQRFPEMEESILRFVDILSVENEYIEEKAKSIITVSDGGVNVEVKHPEAVFRRACVMAMKRIGIKKDYEKAHIDALVELRKAETGKKISLLNKVYAIKEYGKITFYKSSRLDVKSYEFSVGEFDFGVSTVHISEVVVSKAINYKDEKCLFVDGDMIPKGAIIRYRKKGDVFTKFGGGTKNLGDFLTDKKVAMRVRDSIPIVALKNEVFVVCGIEISDKVKLTSKTKRILKIEVDKNIN